MNRWQLLVLAVSVVGTNAGVAQDVSANATRPSASDNAYLTATGYAEVELGWTRVKTQWSVPALMKVGLHKRIEIGMAMSGIVDRPDGGDMEVGTPGLQAKLQFIEHPAGAVAATLRVDWPSNTSPLYTLSPIGTLQTQTLQIDVTLSGTMEDLAGSGYTGAVGYAAAFSPKLRGNLGIYGEVFGRITEGESAHSIDVGVSYAATPRFIMDLSAGFGLTDDATDWIVQIGLTSTLFRLLPR